MFSHASREKHGVRWWWHFSHRNCFHVELSWWTHFCHLSLEATGEGWKISAALPPLAVWLIFDGFGLWHPQCKHIFTWDNNREVWLPDQREAQVSIYDWTIRVTPWGKSMEWCKADPWWVRGLSFDLKLLLGRQQYTRVVVKADMPIQIPMPEGVHRAVATFEHATWKRPLWLARTLLFTSVNVPKGLPFAGKGENSWDCGDDGLYGYSVEGHDIDKAIAHGVESALRSRRRHGHASPDAVREALT